MSSGCPTSLGTQVVRTTCLESSKAIGTTETKTYTKYSAFEGLLLTFQDLGHSLFFLEPTC